MNIFSNASVRLATRNDADEIVRLLNSAYRGEGSKKGWTTEAHLIGGETRANKEMALQAIDELGSVMLLYTNDLGTISGCVNLKKEGNRLYLGMFAVSPEDQGAGIGKILLKASEELAGLVKCESIYMTVISVRNDLIAWYQRHGYVKTGETRPFAEDGITGNHLQRLDFMVLEKFLPA